MTKQFEGFKEVPFNEWDAFRESISYYSEEDGKIHYFIKEQPNEFQGENFVFEVDFSFSKGMLRILDRGSICFNIPIKELPALELAIKRSKEIRGIK